MDIGTRGLEGKLLGNKETLSGGNPKLFRASLPLGAQNKTVVLAGSFRVPSPAQKTFFSLLFFCPTIIDKERKNHKTILIWNNELPFFLSSE